MGVAPGDETVPEMASLLAVPLNVIAAGVTARRVAVAAGVTVTEVESVEGRKVASPL